MTRRVPLVGKKRALGQLDTGKPHLGSQIRYEEDDCRCSLCVEAHRAWYEMMQNPSKTAGKLMNMGTRNRLCRKCGKIKATRFFTDKKVEHALIKRKGKAYVCDRCKRHRYDIRKKREENDVKEIRKDQERRGWKAFPDD